MGKVDIAYEGRITERKGEAESKKEVVFFASWFKSRLTDLPLPMP